MFLQVKPYPVMKIYTFAPIAAREYPTLALLDNSYGACFCLNVSEKPYSPELTIISTSWLNYSMLSNYSSLLFRGGHNY